MTNIYVGFHDQRSCNRILKPPGGGTSNIFGTDLVPDVIPQVSPRKENKHSSTGSTIQHVLQTESVTTVSRKEEKSSTTNGTVTVKQVSTAETHEDGEILENDIQELVPVTQEIIEQQNGSSTPDIGEVTNKVEHLRIEERSSKSEVSETDSAGNTKIISSTANSEGSVERNSGYKRGTSIEEVLKQDDIEEKKKVKGQVQRVPPGGYSSGLW